MADLHPWPKHRMHGCDDPACKICEGGLALCTVCGGAEGSMPSECPGTRMTDNQEVDVYSGILDFTHTAGWHDPNLVDGKTNKRLR